MAIRIQIHDTKIPIEFGDLTFEFDMGDTSMKEVRKKCLEMQERATKLGDLIDESDDEKAEEIAEKYVKDSFEYLLGEGAYEKIYKLTPSIDILTDYFFQLVDGLQREMNIRSGHEKYGKYLGG